MASDSNPTGRRLGKYEIRGELGRGGMGVVYAAYDPSLDRPVAIKVLDRRFAEDPSRLRRFQREALALGQLNHPNIVAVFESGSHGSTHFIAMEYVNGLSVARLLKEQGAFEARAAARVACQVAAALAQTHRLGVIHRDIKPHNVIVDNEWRAKVLDFGVARLSSAPSTLTADGTYLGTPHYMSPEQCRGGALNAQTDIYSLGVMLFEMLTGRCPFSGDTPLAVLHQICSASFPAVTEWRSDTPPALARITSLMTAREPEDRYGDAEEVRADLEACLDTGAAPLAEARLGATASARPPSRRAKPWLNRVSSRLAALPQGRRRLAVLAAIGVLIAAAAFLHRLVPSSQSGPGSRTLLFPEDQAAGLVFVADIGPEGAVGDYQQFGLARGTVAVPAGKAVRLTVRDKGPEGLSWMTGLDPEAIQELDLRKVSIEDGDVAHFVGQQSLWRLVVHGNTVTDRGAADIGRLAALRELDLRDSEIGDAGFAALCNLPNLESLDLSAAPGVGDAGFAQVANLTSLRTLWVFQSNVTDVGLEALTGLRGLTVLRLNKNWNTTDAGLAHIGRIASLEKLILDFVPDWGEYTREQWEGFRSSFDAGVRSREEMGIPVPGIGDVGARHLSSLRNLTVLELDNTHITDEGVRAIAGLTSLTELSLVMNWGISDACLPYLGQLKALSSLDLSGNAQITHEGLAHLRGISGLESLTLEVVYVTEDCVPALVNLKNLKTLNLSQTFVSDSVLEQLRAGLLGCNVSIHSFGG